MVREAHAVCLRRALMSCYKKAAGNVRPFERIGVYKHEHAKGRAALTAEFAAAPVVASDRDDLGHSPSATYHLSAVSDLDFCGRRPQLADGGPGRARVSLCGAP